jgi:hypothetical protein
VGTILDGDAFGALIHVLHLDGEPRAWRAGEHDSVAGIELHVEVRNVI